MWGSFYELNGCKKAQDECICYWHSVSVANITGKRMLFQNCPTMKLSELNRK